MTSTRQEKVADGRTENMAEPQDYPEDDPRHHTIRLKAMLDEARQHAREDIGKIKDPKGQALLK